MPENLRQVRYKDEFGRLFLRLLPEEAPDSEAEWGVPVGPPPLAPLGLPLNVEVALNNELFNRGLLTERDMKHRRQEIHAALMAALRIDVDQILAAATGKEQEVGHT